MFIKCLQCYDVRNLNMCFVFSTVEILYFYLLFLYQAFLRVKAQMHTQASK